MMAQSTAKTSQSNGSKASAPVISFAAMKILIAGCLCMFALETAPAASTNEPAGATPAESPGDTRHGLFNWLDTRSQHGQGVFPEPFLVDDSDLEPGEARLDWLHTQQPGQARSDVVMAEVEKAFGVVTFELEVPYQYDSAPGSITHGFDNVNFGARSPIYQFVSPNGGVDLTFGAGIEAGIPNGSAFSKNAELVPKIFNNLKVGNFTTQCVLGYSTLFGPGSEGDSQTFEYGLVFGYTIPHERLRLPAVQEVIPVFELRGDTGLNNENFGHNTLLGNTGFRLNMKAIGRIQPRPGVGFVFPIDSGARAETHWGVITSLVFEF
jgi:hypothetical protein